MDREGSEQGAGLGVREWALEEGQQMQSEGRECGLWLCGQPGTWKQPQPGPFSMTDGTQCLQLTAHGADRRKGVNKHTKDVTAEGGESCGDQELVIQEEGTVCAKARR